MKDNIIKDILKYLSENKDIIFSYKELSYGIEFELIDKQGRKNLMTITYNTEDCVETIFPLFLMEYLTSVLFTEEKRNLKYSTYNPEIFKLEKL